MTDVPPYWLHIAGDHAVNRILRRALSSLETLAGNRNNAPHLANAIHYMELAIIEVGRHINDRESSLKGKYQCEQ